MPRRFAELVRSRRRARGLTVEDLAERLDCDASTVRRWERGAAFPGPRHMAALRAALTIPLDVLEEACAVALSQDRRRLRIESVEHLERTGKDWERLLAEIIALDVRNLGITDPRDEGTVAQWVPIHRMAPESWRVLADGDTIVGGWHVIALTRRAFARVLAGALRDGEITTDDVEPPFFPGIYNCYVSAFVLDPPYRFGAPFQRLFDSLAEQVERYAAAGVFFREVATPGFTPEGRRLCERLGFERVNVYAGDREKPVYRASVRTLVGRPEFDRFDALRRLYEGE